MNLLPPSPSIFWICLHCTATAAGLMRRNQSIEISDESYSSKPHGNPYKPNIPTAALETNSFSLSIYIYIYMYNYMYIYIHTYIFFVWLSIKLYLIDFIRDFPMFIHVWSHEFCVVVRRDGNSGSSGNRKAGALERQRHWRSLDGNVPWWIGVDWLVPQFVSVQLVNKTPII